MARSEEEAKQLIEPIFFRIDGVLDEIRKRDAGLVSRIAQEVEEDGDLDPYWARKLEMLLELGVVL
ncbi:hypothetical protein P350_10845 [Burkholderia cepacia JBK9]|nr:hypothetical protein P350_10845 [Burkholderia cepacia JBK9]